MIIIIIIVVRRKQSLCSEKGHVTVYAEFVKRKPFVPVVSRP